MSSASSAISRASASALRERSMVAWIAATSSLVANFFDFLGAFGAAALPPSYALGPGGAVAHLDHVGGEDGRGGAR